MAFAGCRFQASAVEDMHGPSFMSNEASLLQSADRQGYSWPPHAQHGGHEFLSHEEAILFNAVKCRKQPTREALL